MWLSFSGMITLIVQTGGSENLGIVNFHKNGSISAFQREFFAERYSYLRIYNLTF